LKKTAKAPSLLQQRLMNPNQGRAKTGPTALGNQINSAIGNVNSMIGGGNAVRKTNA